MFLASKHVGWCIGSRLGRKNKLHLNNRSSFTLAVNSSAAAALLSRITPLNTVKVGLAVCSVYILLVDGATWIFNLADLEPAHNQGYHVSLALHAIYRKKRLQIYTVDSYEYKRLKRIQDSIVETAKINVQSEMDKLNVKQRFESHSKQTERQSKLKTLTETLNKLNSEWELYIVGRPDGHTSAFVRDQKVILTSGLLESELTDAAFAILIGHEIAHVICGHMGKIVEFQKVQGQDGCKPNYSSDFFDSPISHHDSCFELRRENSLYKFLQSNEYEADALGLHLAAHAGYDVHHGLRRFGESCLKHWKACKNGDDEDCNGFVRSTHPPGWKRYEKLQQLVKKYPEKQVSLDRFGKNCHEWCMIKLCRHACLLYHLRYRIVFDWWSWIRWKTKSHMFLLNKKWEKFVKEGELSKNNEDCNNKRSD